MVNNTPTIPCLLCNANLNQKASFCHECGIAIDDQEIDTPSNISQFNDLVRESFFDIEAWHDIGGLNQETFDFRKNKKISYQSLQTIFDKFNNYRLKHKHLSDFQIEFDENVHDAYADHDTHLTFKITNLSKSKRYKAYIFWDDRETDDEEDLHIKSVSFINMGKSAELGGTHIFTRVGPKTISDLIVTITDQLKNEARFKVEPFRFRVKNPTQQTINQISNKNQISIEGRGVVDASNMGSETSVLKDDLEPKWKKLDFHLIYKEEENFSEKLNIEESNEQTEYYQDTLENQKSFDEKALNTEQSFETKFHNIHIPDLGKSDYIKIINWSIPEGASFNKNDVIANVETDKVTAEIPAHHPGTLEKIFVEPGNLVHPNQVIAQYSSSQEPNEINSEFKASTIKKNHSNLDEVPSLKFPIKPVSLINVKDKDGWYSTNINNDKYKGQLNLDSFPTGYGLYYFHNGDIFEGTFETDSYGLKEGIYKFFNGDKFEGKFINYENISFENGCYTWADGQSYTGDFVDNQRAYSAEWKLIDGTIRLDTWAEDHPFWKSYPITLNSLFNKNLPQTTPFKIIDFYNHSRLETKKRVKKNDPILLIEFESTEFLIYSPIDGKFEIFNEYEDFPLQCENAQDSIGEMHITLLEVSNPPPSLDYKYTTKTVTIENETIPNTEVRDKSNKPQPFDANEYSSDELSKSYKIKKLNPKNNKKKNKIWLFVFIILGILGGVYAHDQVKPCDAIVLNQDYKCKSNGSCIQIYDKFLNCRTDNNTASCIDKWGKTMSVDDFNKFTGIKGKLFDSNSRYKVSGPNYSSRWIKVSWYYYNDDIGIEEYGNDIVVGPVGSEYELTESFADLKDLSIYDSDKDGWRLQQKKFVETACYSPQP